MVAPGPPIDRLIYSRLHWTSLDRQTVPVCVSASLCLSLAISSFLFLFFSLSVCVFILQSVCLSENSIQKGFIGMETWHPKPKHEKMCNKSVSVSLSIPPAPPLASCPSFGADGWGVCACLGGDSGGAVWSATSVRLINSLTLRPSPNASECKR